MFEKDFVIEEGVVYHRQKPLHKQALFWTTIAGAVISVFLHLGAGPALFYWSIGAQ